MTTEYDTLEVPVEEARAPSRKLSAVVGLVILAGIGAVAFVAGTSGIALRATVNAKSLPGETECPPGTYSHCPEEIDDGMGGMMPNPDTCPKAGSGDQKYPCLVCPEATYQPATASTSCIPCGDSGDDDYVLTNCAPGMDNAGSGIGCERHEKLSKASCIKVRKSIRLSEALAAKQECDIGYYSTGINADDPAAADYSAPDGFSPCAICPADTYQDAPGETSCKQCPMDVNGEQMHTCDPTKTDYAGSGVCTANEHDDVSDCENRVKDESEM